MFAVILALRLSTPSLLDAERIEEAIGESKTKLVSTLTWSGVQPTNVIGGAINVWANGELRVFSCLFQSCCVTVNANDKNRGGGALGLGNVAMTMYDTEILDCWVDGTEKDLCFGGAIFCEYDLNDRDARINITSSKFDNCRATRGGAIYITGGESSKLKTLIFMDCNVTRCFSSEAKDGAILYSSLAISEIHFQANAFDGQYLKPCISAISFSVESTVDVLIDDCSFDANTQILTRYLDIRGFSSIHYRYCHFANMKTTGEEQATGVFQKGITAPLTVEFCNFTAMTASVRAAAIHTYSSPKVEITHCRFESCTTERQNGANTVGAVLVEGVQNLEVSISDCDFIKNVSPYSQSLLITIPYEGFGVITANVSRCVFSEHVSEQPLFVVLRYNAQREEANADYSMTITQCEFRDNIISGTYGVMKLISNQEVVYSGCQFVNNQVTGNGPVLELGSTNDAKRSFEDCTFDSCCIDGTGIVIASQSSVGELAFLNTNFTKCAPLAGILSESLSAVSMAFNNCLFEELKRDGEFTVLTARATSLGMENCRFVNCGGSIGVTGDEINFDQVTITESSVSSLAVTAAQKLAIQYSTFSCQNNALAMTFTGPSVVINHTLFSVETPLKEALLTLTAGDSADIHFYNCCFTCEPTLSFPYLNLTGSGNATFVDVCFDREAAQCIQTDGVIVNYDDNVGFGSCQCWGAETFTSEPSVMTDTEEITTEEAVVTPDESGGKDVDVGMIVGIVIGILVVIAVVCVVLILVLRRRNANQSTISQEQEQELPEETQPPSVSSMSVDEWGPSVDNEMFRSDNHTELFAETFEENL